MLNNKESEYESRLIGRSNEIGELATSLALAQLEVQDPLKNKTNPHFKSNYADLTSVLAEVRKVFAGHGLSLPMFPVVKDGKVGVVYMLLHSSGQYLEAELLLTPDKTTPQGAGSAITYARRFALQAVCSVAADDDDDGHEASTPQKKQEPKEQEKPKEDPVMDEATWSKFFAQGEKRGWTKFKIYKLASEMYSVSIEQVPNKITRLQGKPIWTQITENDPPKDESDTPAPSAQSTPQTTTSTEDTGADQSIDVERAKDELIRAIRGGGAP